MKIRQEQLKQMINEEIEKLATEGQLDEAASEYWKSMFGAGKEAGSAAFKKAGELASAGAEKFKQKVVSPIQAAHKTSMKASAASDIPVVAQKALQTIMLGYKELENLSQRMEKLRMTYEIEQLDKVFIPMERTVRVLQKIINSAQKKTTTPAEE